MFINFLRKIFLVGNIFILFFCGINFTLANSFPDAEGHINEIAIEYLKSQTIVKGYPDGTFKPERSINRAEFVKVVLGALPDFSQTELENCKISSFSDVETKQWYAPYICYAKEKGLISGYPDGSFQPSRLVNFAEASKIITLAQKLNPKLSDDFWYQGYVEKLEENFAIPMSVQTFGSNLVRGEMAEILWRLKTKNQTQPSKRFFDLEEVNEIFPQIKSCSELKKRLQNGTQNTSYSLNKRNLMRDVDDAVFNATESETMPTQELQSLDTGSDDFSQTNLQVEGVDEADIIKNDGKYIYLIKNSTIRIIEAYPPSKLKEIAKIELDDIDFSPYEIYTDTNQMVIIGQSYQGYQTYGDKLNLSRLMPYPINVEKTKVYIYDISNRANPKEQRSIEYEGSYKNSRKIDKNLYLVMNKSVSFYEPWLYDSTKTEDSTDENLVPKILDSRNNQEQSIVKCGDIHFFPHYLTPNYLIVSGIDISNSNSEISKEVYLGASENVFASKDNLYITTSAWDEEQVIEKSETYWKRMENTLIYKFALDGAKISFSNKGKVPGRILNQFSMDEYKNYFRIATTKGEVWNDHNPSTNNLYVLDSDLNLTGTIEGIAPGEKIYSVRFMGDRGFMVTFKTVDPLFVIDLKNPQNPIVKGKLKIPGWSDYLHPYDENHLLGFGKEVDESIDADKVHSESAVYYTAVQGMKLSLFDISDLENPKEIFKEVIGARDTTSELLQNHKALLFDKNKELLAFPVTVTEDKSKSSECNKYTYSTCPSSCTLQCLPSVCNTNGACTSDCGDVIGSCVPEDNYGNIQTVFQGAYVYTVNLKDGFKLRGKITHYDDPDIFIKSGDYFYGDYEKNIQRIIYIGDYLYSISQNMIKALGVVDVVEKAKLDVE